MSRSAPQILLPDWPAPQGVHAVVTLRGGGVSQGPYASLNLGIHVGDDRAAVAENRRRLAQALALPAEPAWMEQVHGAEVCALPVRGSLPSADAAIARTAGEVAVVQVADCLPVLFAARAGGAVAAAHAGWRGLAAGVLEATVRALGVPPAQLLAWLGPAIGAAHFEVGAEVRGAFLAQDPAAAAAFLPNSRGRWQCDLVQLARARLRRAGVTALYGDSPCTYADPQRFFSHRRAAPCGRMAALIWLG
ncbi:MAG: peptidoglycan editing factor PgeF [Gammaproteobacteria bacterium]|nr:peptidoglycan editing factor PgeF [Gammaproteobacteria bacterium]